MPLTFKYTKVAKELRPQIEAVVRKHELAAQAKVVRVRRIQREGAALVHGQPCDDVLVVNLYDAANKHIIKLRGPTDYLCSS